VGTPHGIPTLPSGGSGKEKEPPIPTVGVGSRTVVKAPDHQDPARGWAACAGGGLHQRGDLKRRIARPGQWVATAGLAGKSIQAEVALRHARLAPAAGGSEVTAIVVEHRDQLVRRNVDLIQAARAADGWPLVAGR
jgi:hypothetical protein